MRLVSWNIHHGAPVSGRVDLDAFASAMRTWAPDVVVLQEVDRMVARSGSVDQAAWLGAQLGMEAHFVRAMDVGGGEYGNAVLTCRPCGAPRVIELPHRRPREPRVAAVVRLELDEGTLTVAGTHLQNGPRFEPKPTEAMRQLRSLLDDLATVDGAVVLAGDMNAERRQVCSILEPAGYTVAMTAPTFPADRPRRTIDVVAARGAAIAEVRVPVTTASDHRPIVVDLGLSATYSG